MQKKKVNEVKKKILNDTNSSASITKICWKIELWNNKVILAKTFLFNFQKIPFIINS